MRVDWYSVLERLYEFGGRKTYHVKELAQFGAELGVIPMGTSQDQFASDLSQYLARNVKSKAPQFSKVKNGSNGFRRGVYRIKPQKSLPLTPVAPPRAPTNYVGKAGEFAVMSELLFRGFNASVMSVDEGIDLVASKDGRYFHIQVKTANKSDTKPYLATIKSSALKQGGDVYYVIVLRVPTEVRIYNEYAIFSSLDIRRWIGEGILKDGQSISLRISAEKNRFRLNNVIDVSSHINDFDVIC